MLDKQYIREYNLIKLITNDVVINRYVNYYNLKHSIIYNVFGNYNDSNWGIGSKAFF
jgi:hypothetical protein